MTYINKLLGIGGVCSRVCWLENDISPSKLQLQALHLLMMLLPEPNRDTLKALLEFLSKVVANEEKNRMSLWNVSMIVAPNLFMYKGKTANPQEMQGAAGAAHVVRLLVKYQDILWTMYWLDKEIIVIFIVPTAL
ncbi:UNVERIFIED_CONTAM: hypothetical protein FKN15_018378 [Acipenser sinensis]